MRASAIGLIALLASLTACDTGVGSTTRVFPNVNPSPAPSDTHYNDQWALPLLSAREAWGIIESEEFSDSFDTAVVAVLDTMFDLDHPDLSGVIRVSDGWDFVDPSFTGFSITDNPGSDDVDHGTHVAGIIAAVNNSIGVSGIGKGLVEIMPVRVLNDQDKTDLSVVYTAIRYAAGLDSEAPRRPARPASVINLSLGAPPEGGLSSTDLEIFESLAKELQDRGVSVVAAAGNAEEGQPARSSVDLPALFPGILAIGSIDKDKSRSSFSSYGQLLDFVAPGGFSSTGSGIWSTVYDGGSG
ncbi:MAG: S8 family serine peptidase, partial [Spirochaetaceae bacterium]